MHLLAFAGSSRSGSYNQQLLQLAMTAAREAGAEVTHIDLRALELPLFDQDIEAASGLPVKARELKARMKESDGFIVASPEYNSSITPLLKNTLDWVSRAETDNEQSLVAFRGKTAALFSASPGGLGGMRALVHLRSLLGNIGVLVMPQQVTISAAYEAFDEAGKLKDVDKQKQVGDLARLLVETTRKLRA